MVNIIKCPNKFRSEENDKKLKVFLMGPIQGAPEWQFTVPDFDDVIWLSPRREKYPVPNFNYDEQVDWETDAINYADIILVWIPKEEEHVEGRSYAQTTRFEIGENLAKGKRMIIGIEDGFPGRKYFEYKAKKYSNVITNTVYSTFEECLDLLEKTVKPIRVFRNVGLDVCTMRMRLNTRGYKMPYLYSLSFDKLKKLYDYCQKNMI